MSIEEGYFKKLISRDRFRKIKKFESLYSIAHFGRVPPHAVADPKPPPTPKYAYINRGLWPQLFEYSTIYRYIELVNLNRTFLI